MLCGMCIVKDVLKRHRHGEAGPAQEQDLGEGYLVVQYITEQYVVGVSINQTIHLPWVILTLCSAHSHIPFNMSCVRRTKKKDLPAITWPSHLPENPGCGSPTATLCHWWYVMEWVAVSGEVRLAYRGHKSHRPPSWALSRGSQP